MGIYEPRKEIFIKQIAKAKGISQQDARAFYRDYERQSKAQRKKISKNVRKRINERYEEKHPAQEERNRNFKFPKVKKQKKQKGRLIKKAQKQLPINQKRNKKQLLQKKQTKRKLPQKKIIQKKSSLGGKITEKT